MIACMLTMVTTLMVVMMLSSGDDKFLMELESQFRSFLLKISESTGVLQPLPPGKYILLGILDPKTSIVLTRIMACTPGPI